jgi:two-component system chemotaxis response regulator CheY
VPPDCLIADDSRMIRAIARNLIESLGLSVAEAADGREALIQCEHAMPRMILLDWNMPEMDGPAVITALRGRPGPQPKILLCSTETRLGVVRAAMRIGASSYLLKPFDRAALAHRIRRFGLLPRPV